MRVLRNILSANCGPARQAFQLSLLFATSALLVSCASKRLLLEPVGPSHSLNRATGGEGRLIVFTSRETYTSGEVDYFHHSSFRITTPDGKPVRYVRNYSDVRDSNPEPVAIAAGLYTIVARSDSAGTVSIPVVVESLKTTEVHLVRDWKPDLAGRDRSDLVLLPNGQPVGWRASVKGHEEIDEAKAKRADAVLKVKLIKSPESFGTVAYSLVEPVAVLRNKTERTFAGQFTVGFKDIAKGVQPGVSNIYLKQVTTDAGLVEWRLLED
ncbi:MAG: hypothetical protein HY301_00610 [Verrucomicrobia bacterium]|nr:hypothetical protein [Verrucomicrobiota bacterium]